MHNTSQVKNKMNKLSRMITLYICLIGTVTVLSGQDVVPTNTWSSWYGTRLYSGCSRAVLGDLIQAFDEDGVLCGQFIVNETGQFGYLHVYGDDPLTEADEGANQGDLITFKINGESAQTVGSVQWISGNPGSVNQVDMYINAYPPMIEDFPAGYPIGMEEVLQIPLDEYVFDQEDPPGDLQWSTQIIEGLDLSITINPEIHYAAVQQISYEEGNSLVQFKVTDPSGCADSVRVNFQIISYYNIAPQIISPAVIHATEEEAFTYQVEVFDPDSPVITFEYTGLPDWVTAEADSVWGTPPEGVPYGLFTVIAADEESWDTLEVYIDVTQINDPPVLNEIGDQFVEQDSTLQLILEATDVDDWHLIFSAISDQDSVMVSVATDTLSLIPALGWFGTAHITVEVSDGELSDSEVFLLTVGEVVPGCTDPEALNFNPDANVDDGSCIYGTLGDVDQSGTIDVLDVVIVVGIIIGSLQPSEYQIWAGDITQDGSIDVLDVVVIVGIIISR